MTGVQTCALPISYGAGLSVGLYIEGGPLPSGHYRFTANSTLTDRAGNALDGDGDSAGGDAYGHIFDVLLPGDMDFEGQSNDTLQTATTLTLSEDPSGSGYLIARGLGSINPSTDQDWWSFPALAGDLISLSVDTPGSDLRPSVYLYSDTGSYLTADTNYSGPGYDVLTAPYTAQYSGSYYVRVDDYSYTGSYQLRVDIARGIALENDYEYRGYDYNDTVGTANDLPFTIVGTHRTGTIAGTIMAAESGVDEDYFNLGTVQNGETIFLNLRLPNSSDLIPVIEVRDASNNVVQIIQDPTGTVGRASISALGNYYATVVGLSGQGPRGQYLLDAAIWPTGELASPDLAFSDVSTPTNASSGETIHVTWTIGNYGTGNTEVSDWFDRVVLSVNETFGDSDDIYLGSVTHTGILLVNEQYTASADVQLPLDSSGDYWLLIEADETNAVFEYILDRKSVV